MEKELLISIHPEYAFNILLGKKTIELRNWIPKNFIGWVNVCITKAKPYCLYCDDGKFLFTRDKYALTYSNLDFNYIKLQGIEILNGKIPFRFWFEHYKKAQPSDFLDFIIKACVVGEYLNSNEFKGLMYAWSIDKLEVFENPKLLDDFSIKDKRGQLKTLRKAPQKCAYVYQKESE